MKIGLLSFADCNNYGDKFFAPLSRFQLGKLLPDAEIVQITPTGASIEGDLYSAYDTTELNKDYTALLMVGGEVVHTEDHLFLDIYARQGLVSKLPHPTDLVFASPYLEAPYKAWLATGISSSIISAKTATKLGQVVPLLNRITLRGSLAKDNLDAVTGRNLYTEVVPDLGWLIPFVDEVKNASIDHLAVPGKFDPARPYLIFHTFAAMVRPPDTLAGLASTLMRLQAETGLQIVLLPITYYTGDSQFLQELNRATGGQFFVMPENMDRHLTAQVMLHATISITSSLHGAITALAAGIPAAVVHAGETKFYDLFGMQQRLQFFRRDWAGLYELARDLLDESRQPLLDYAALQRTKLKTLFELTAAEIRAAADSPINLPLPYRSQFERSGSVRSYRRNEWVHAANLNQLMQDELAATQLRLAEFEVREGDANTAGLTPSPDGQPTGGEMASLQEFQKLEQTYQERLAQQTNRLDFLEEELVRAKKTEQHLASQVLEWRTQYEALQDTRTVRLTRNLRIITNTLMQATKAPFEEVIQGKLNPPELEKAGGPFLTIHGWAASSQGHIEAVEVLLEGISLGEAYYGLERPDIILDRPLQLERHCGFAGRFKLDLDRFKMGPNFLRVNISDSKGHHRQFAFTVFIRPEIHDAARPYAGLEVGPALPDNLELTRPLNLKERLLTRPGEKTKEKDTSGGVPPVTRRAVKLDQIKQVRLFVAKAGNIFMQDIARIFQYGFEQNNLQAEILLDRLPSENPPENCLQIVVAPHEFYPLFLQKELSEQAVERVTRAVYVLNVEQPHSSWFEITARIARQAAGVWDINPQGVNQFERLGIPAQYSPLGYAPFLETTSGAAYSKTDKGEMVERPAERSLDLLFMGSSSKRRERLLAGFSDFMSGYISRLILSRVDRPRLSTTAGYVDAEERSRLLTQSKILLNLHFGEQAYLEWHRVLVAMANRCLFVTEPCDYVEPLVPDKHFIMAAPAELVARCRQYLDDPAAREAMVEEAYRFVTTELDAGVLCRTLLVTRPAKVRA